MNSPGRSGPPLGPRLSAGSAASALGRTRQAAGRLWAVVGLVVLLTASCAGAPPFLLPPSTASDPLPTPRVPPGPGAPQEAPKPHSFPERPITLLVGDQRGGKGDVAARLLTPHLQRLLSLPVVVVNRTAGGGEEAWVRLKEARPDGYTVGQVASPNIHAAVSDPQRKASFAMSDFAPLVGQAQEPLAFFVRSWSTLKSTEDLVRAARAQPDGLTVSVASGHTVARLAATEFQKKTGARLRVTEFADPNAAHLAALSGQVEVGLASVPEVLPSVRSGYGRLLAISSEKRHEDRPEVPTLKEGGIDVVSYFTVGYAVPTETSPDIAEYLRWTLYLATTSEAHRSQMRSAGLTVRFMGGREYAAFLAAEGERVRRLLATQ